ncbi:MAG: N-6 DNA methylase [Gammaproteobacteria bacterium]|nr:N-6 DNA methylase [Gammaproteobacteria bacterium]MBY0544815.1 N-6 DNA methylase [Gammaproteobacteria bacterium]
MTVDITKENISLSETEVSENNFNRERTIQNIDILRQFKAGNCSTLKGYTGFGGLRRAFKDEAIQAELNQILSADELDKLHKSTSTGYFTPDLLIDFIYKAVQHLGFTGGKVLEPACGHGAFFERMPETMRQKSQITGIELEPLSAAMAKALYPDVKIVTGSFQYFHESEFDLIIGNPPYARFKAFDKKHPDLKEEMIHHYFVAKSARLLKENGLLAMIVPCYVLDNPQRHLREQIAEVADLVAAYRLPENLFSDAKVTVDIIILQRKANPSKNWQGASKVTLHNQDRFYLADHFVKNPDHVLGELSTYEAYSHFEERPRRGLRCTASESEVNTRLATFLNELKPLV